jgi:thiamine biosynthesis lipoprotein
MSFHDPESEVSRMNRDACYKLVRVHPWAWRVLKSAQEFSRNTVGIFDITMAGQLVK